MLKRNPNHLDYGSDQLRSDEIYSAHESRASRVRWLGLAFAGLLEGAMLLLFFGVFTETMGLASNQFLSELPGIGALFEIIDEDATVSHLLAFLLAVFSVAVPLAIWNVVLAEGVHLDPGQWLVDPMNRVKAILAGVVYAAVVLLEVVNLYTLIARETSSGPFATQAPTDALTAFLAENQALGIFVALLVAIVNTVLALITVRAAHGVKS
ncbi:hypothetical protein [Ruegeria profundi]|uniref:Uncharacterized protein n=1 Tax=Ruegeria profundi TaxID=1685378 RepID=A0A0X3TVA3_9RHOB|nr:hypothetical protein [Ruegeria profundi]KUJ77230.1 hypothetical protein AVO44_17745 [Ruegeria profundi]